MNTQTNRKCFLVSKAIVVDDTSTYRDIACQILRRDASVRYDIQTADNGKQAIEIYNFFKPELVITDLFMPILDGFQLIAFLLDQKPIPSIIAMSGGLDRESASSLSTKKYLGIADTLGASSIVNKSAIVRQLPAALEKLNRKTLLLSDTQRGYSS